MPKTELSIDKLREFKTMLTDALKNSQHRMAELVEFIERADRTEQPIDEQYVVQRLEANVWKTMFRWDKETNQLHFGIDSHFDAELTDVPVFSKDRAERYAAGLKRDSEKNGEPRVYQVISVRELQQNRIDEADEGRKALMKTLGNINGQIAMAEEGK